MLVVEKFEDQGILGRAHRERRKRARVGDLYKGPQGQIIGIATEAARPGGYVPVQTYGLMSTMAQPLWLTAMTHLAPVRTYTAGEVVRYDEVFPPVSQMWQSVIGSST